MDTHQKHCFIVMPFGSDEREKRWFDGWYKQIIAPAVVDADYEPFLAAASNEPNDITQDLLTHLAFDPMVVVDLGGMTPEDSPNPNVMYELGIRHAFNKPCVIMAWKDQKLPFDVGSQRAIMEERDFSAMSANKAKLIEFIKNAERGAFYKPMEAVRRTAQLELTADASSDNILATIAGELSDIKRGVWDLVTDTAAFKEAVRLETLRLLKSEESENPTPADLPPHLRQFRIFGLPHHLRRR